MFSPLVRKIYPYFGDGQKDVSIDCADFLVSELRMKHAIRTIRGRKRKRFPQSNFK